MYKYFPKQQTNKAEEPRYTIVIRISDGALIPMVEDNIDYQEVLKWVAASNKFVPGVAAAALSYSSSTFTGNGTLANYAIPAGRSVDDVLVYLNGVAQVPTTDYTIATTVLTFGVAPLTGQSIVFRFLPV